MKKLLIALGILSALGVSAQYVAAWKGLTVGTGLELTTSNTWLRSTSITNQNSGNPFPISLVGVRFDLWDNGTGDLTTGSITNIRVNVYFDETRVVSNLVLNWFTTVAGRARSDYIPLGSNIVPCVSNSAIFFEACKSGGSADSTFLIPNYFLGEIR